MRDLCSVGVAAVTIAADAKRYNAGYAEFLETGIAEQCGYTSPAEWIANLYSHVFTIEHQRLRLGPHVRRKKA